MATRRHRETHVRIILNGDDLGRSPEVNDAIFNLMASGRLTSATLIANAPYAEVAARHLSKFPMCSFGAHLNLTEFRPLTRDPALEPLLEEGTFRDRVRDVRITSRLAAAAERELIAQVARLMGLGVRVSHLDSHQHVHTLPSFFGVLKRVQKRFDIRRVRISKNVYSPALRPGRSLLLRKWLWNTALRRFYSTRTTAAFTSFAEFYGLCGADRRLRRRLT